MAEGAEAGIDVHMDIRTYPMSLDEIEGSSVDGETSPRFPTRSARRRGSDSGRCVARFSTVPVRRHHRKAGNLTSWAEPYSV